ncbi:hypothetical protein SLS61_000712 [Didymella pomorum]
MGILDLADELLRIILEHVASEPEKLISLERRAYLSQESFKPPPPIEPDQAETIANVRLTCRKFADLGAIHQFSRVTTRFSRRGLKRLENIASQRHLAERVKKFSYMVPFFYVEGRERVQDLLPTLPGDLGLLDASHFVQKIKEQKDICSRFSSPMLSPVSVLGAANNPPSAMALLAERLTCLELHFDDGIDLDQRMRDLSSLSKVVFTAAKNIEAVHIGFPSHRPLTLKLEEIFHNVKWDKLQAFGIQAWRLDAEEIIALARRHKETLRGLRLRDVLLKEGSRWRDVLSFLRENMSRLDWVSLRRIDYEKHFDDAWIMGAEVPDDPLGSDSSDESDDWDPHDDDYDHADDQDEAYDSDDGSVGDSDSDAGTDEPEEGGNLHFPPLSPDTPASVPWCTCNGHMDSADFLNDDGQLVSYQQRKFWEKWVVRKACTEQHGHK